VNEFDVAVDLPVQLVFPSRYVLDLTAPPPASVPMHADAYPGIGVAYGVLSCNTSRAILCLDSTTSALPAWRPPEVSRLYERYGFLLLRRCR
jgi:hypothetical protein